VGAQIAERFEFFLLEGSIDFRAEKQKILLK